MFRMAYSLAKEVFIVGAKRTAFGNFGGALASYSANDLQTIANIAALNSAGVEAAQVDTTTVGNVMQSSADAAYIARYVTTVAMIMTICLYRTLDMPLSAPVATYPSPP